MAYTRRHWVDYPDTSTPIDADALNNIEDGIEESHNIQLLAVTDTVPSECAEGDKYYDTTTKLIYTATGTDEWGETGETPIADILYIVLDEQSTYTYDGTDLVSVGGSGGGTNIINEYSESTTDGYSANYLNNLLVDSYKMSSNGYIRFKNGIQFAWSEANKEVTLTAWGNIYYADVTDLPNWEVPFTQVYQSHVTTNNVQFWGTTSTGGNTKPDTVRLLRPTAGTFTLYVKVFAVGRWK